jgi:hypothetical protein
MLTYTDLESEAERLLWDRIESGQPLDCRVGGPERDDPVEGGSWGQERSLRAELLIELLTIERRPSGQRPRALRLDGARIKGNLDLEAATLVCPIVLNGCHLEAPLTLDEARAQSIRLVGCAVPSISGRQLETHGDLTLDRVTAKKLDLEGAHVGGQLSFNWAKLHQGLIAYGLRIDQDMLCREVTANGQVSLAGAEIGGKLSFELAKLHEDLILSGAHIGSLLSFDGATLQGLIGDGLRVGRSMFCRKGFTAGREVRLDGANIGSRLWLESATLHKALIAEGLQVDWNMLCQKVTVKGEVRLRGTHVGGRLSFNGTRLHEGLVADRLQVDQDMCCEEGFSAEGEVRMAGAHIAGQLSFDGAKLAKRLLAYDLQVDQSMLFGALACGEVRMPGAHIAELLSFDGATLSGTECSLHLGGARIDRELRMHLAERPAGIVDLTNVRVARLLDSEATWPMKLRLQGCVYTSVQATEDVESPPETAPAKRWQLASLRRLRPRKAPDMQRRLKWIRLSERAELGEMGSSRRATQRSVRVLQSNARASDRPPWLHRRLPSDTRRAQTTATEYAPQPYTQLISVYRQEGRDSDARHVAYEREFRRRGQLRLPGKAWNLFLQGTVGYGYKPLRALGWLAALVLVGTLAFSSFHSDGQLVPIESHHPPFVASIYTLDRLIPVVSFGLRDAFAPSGAAQWLAFAYTLLGWVLTIAVVAGLNATVRRD